MINPAAGGVAPGAAEVVETLAAQYGLSVSVTCPEPEAIEAALRAAIDTAPDLLVVLAGDGTARLAAELAGPDGPLIAPLAGGTMNLLPHALYGTSPWQEVLAALLGTGVERPVSGGRVCGKPFFAAALFGSPALWSRAREAVRFGDLTAAVRWGRYALRRAFSGEVRYRLADEPHRRAEALVLICPLISRALDRELALEAAALDVRSAGEVVRLALNGALGDWRKDPSVEVALCERGSVWARRALPCILDGEVQRLPRRCEFSFEPRAFRALAPPPGPAAT